jgi:riboflavin kinase / FMN adenylyltransferase
MEVLIDPGQGPCAPSGTVVTIGAYDGVHVGHQELIGRVRERASARGVPSAVVTFDRHPATVVRPDSAPKLLTDLDQKVELLGATGIDVCVVLTFDEARSRESAAEFVREVLVGCLRAGLVVVGTDFHFGHARQGNVALLEDMGRELGFEVEGVTPFPEAGGRTAVSSTRIRDLLSAGKVEDASKLLGRLYEVRGPVERGDGRGGPVLGFPTANVAVPSEVLLPAEGIYAGWYERPDGSVHQAAISLSRRPQFYDHADAPLLEAYLLGFSGHLYGEWARVRFVARLREDRRFSSVEELVAQTGRDVDAVRSLLVG